MRSNRFIVALVALALSGVLLVVGIVYLFTGTPNSAATDPGPAEPSNSEPSNSEPETTPGSPPDTGAAWRTTNPATPSVPEPTPPPASELGRKGLSADALVTTAAEVMVTWDTATDVSPTDGYRRALPLFVDEYKDIFVTPAKPVLPEDWWIAAEHEASSTPQVQITDTYPQGNTTTYYVAASWTWRSNDGWTLTPDPKHMTFQVTRDSTGYVIQNWTDQQLQ